jgi:ketosteroid isomerase-like protein
MKRTRIYCLAFAAACCLLINCTTGSPEAAEEAESTSTFDLAAAKEIIMAKNVAFCEAHITGDTALLNNIFTRDARIFVPNAEMVTDRETIVAVNLEYINYGITEFTEETIAFYGNEDFLVDEGTYILAWGEDGQRDVGKYLNVWKQEDGEWKMQTNVWNSDLPAQ